MDNFENFEDLDGEIWKDLPDFEGIYQVSTKGRVRSLKDSKHCKPHILKQSPRAL